MKRDELADPSSCLNKANDDEYIFVLIGRDKAATAAIIAWCNERIRLGLNSKDDDKLAKALECANRMRDG